MTMTPAELEEQKDTLELLNNEVTSRLTRQSESLAKIDAKALFLIGFAATAAQFLATRQRHDVLAYCAFAAYAVTLLTGVLAMRVAKHQDLEPRPMLAAHVRSAKGQVLAELAATRASIFEKNKEIHDRKAWLWTASLWSMAVGLGLSTVALLLHT
ncbi:hypothetical protein ACFW96_38615 [Streptomyces gardneri]|uniref:hypothetical protein n=1 Tax=Streptomyces gardneri TaxID=66892 RepID=UPI0036AD173E